MSPKSAGQAKKAGYTNIRVLLAGEPAWVKAGFPTYASHDFVKDGNIILIDLRGRKKDARARIPRSVSIPFDTLDNAIDDIPLKAPVVLYSDNSKEALKALKKFRQAGFRKVSLVEGNLSGWVMAGGALIKDPPVTEITWQRKLAPEEVSLKDFRKALVGKMAGVVILDVRTDDEATRGCLPASKHIPLDQLSTRLGELPKDKKIFIHCTTGARAEMANRELRKHGFKSFYLVASVECDGSECDIEE